MSEGSKLKKVQVLEEGWKKQAEKLCREFQTMGGEMIIVARQPSRQLFACCTSNAEKGMVKNFSTFKDCLPLPQKLVKIAPEAANKSKPSNDKAKVTTETQMEKGKKLVATTSGLVKITPGAANKSKPNNDKAKITTKTQVEKGKKIIATASDKQENRNPETSISKTTKESLKRKILTSDKISEKSEQEDEIFCDLDLEVTEEPGPEEISEKPVKTNHKTDTSKKPKTSNAAGKDIKISLSINKPVLRSALAQSSEKPSDKGDERNSPNAAEIKRIQTNKPSILSRKSQTPKSEAVPVCQASDIVLQFSVPPSKSQSTSTASVPVSSKPGSQTNTVSSKIVLPVFLSSKEAIISSGVAGKDSGNSSALTLTTASVGSPLVSNLASHVQKENSSALKSKEAQAKGAPLKETLNMVLVRDLNQQLCLVPQPSKDGKVQLVGNQVSIPLTSSQAQSANTTSSTPLQSGFVLVPSSLTSSGSTTVAPRKANTTPQKILPKGDKTTAQNNQTTKDLNDTPTTTPTSLPKVFILAAPNSMSSALKSNRSGYILPMSATPKSAVSQAGAATALLSNSTEASTATPKDQTNSTSQLPLVNKELDDPEEGAVQNVNQDGSSPKLQDKEKVSVSTKKKNKVSVAAKSPFVRVGNSLYRLVVMNEQQFLVPVQQLMHYGQKMTTTTTDPKKPKLPKKRKREEGKDSDFGKKQKTSHTPPPKISTNAPVEKFVESESDPEEEDLSEMNEMLEKRSKFNESGQASSSQGPVNKPQSGDETQTHENEQGNSTTPKPNLNDAQDKEQGLPTNQEPIVPKQESEIGFSTNPQPDPSIIPKQENSENSQENPAAIQQQASDHGYSVQQEDIPPAPCILCSFKTCYWKPMADHMRRRHGYKRYCIKCNNFMPSSRFYSHNCTRRGINKNRKQICLICSRLASNAFELIKHYRVSHRTDIEKHCHSNSLYRSVRSQKIFLCKGCGTLEYSEQNMLIHIRKLHFCELSKNKEQQSQGVLKKEPVCVCPVCFFHFPEEEYLKYHMNIFHSGKRDDRCTVECSLCDSTFTSSDELFNHYKTHTPNVKYRCVLCAQHNEPMNSLEEVQRHREIFHPLNKHVEALFLCPEPECQETFHEDVDFVLHVIQHQIGTKYSHTCAKCDFYTSSEILLAKHESKFHYESEKRCHFCTKRFKMPEHLTKHMLLHKTMEKSTSGGDTTFICDRCGQINTSAKKHRRHMSKHKEKDRNEETPCKVCGEVFVSATNAAKHMFKCHPEEEQNLQVPTYPCAFCDYVSLYRGDYRRHMSTHKRTNHFVCKICERGFKDRPGLRSHLKLHKQGRNHRKFRCFACHLDRDGIRMKSHLTTENHKMNCKLAGINLDDYNNDLLNLFPSKGEALKLPRKDLTLKSYIDQCEKVHKEHCKRASLLMVEEKSYTVVTPDGDEIQLDMPSKNPKCEECGLLFKSVEDLEEHREHVRLLELSANRNYCLCEVCDVHFFDRVGAAKHATLKDHIEKCRLKGVEPDDILKKNNISKDVSFEKRKEMPKHGYRCTVCDAYFASRDKKAVHITKDIHVQKCQELGLDPADDHFEDLTEPSNEEKLPNKHDKERKKISRIEKAISKRKKLKLDSIELMGVQVPRLISFECLVCNVMLAGRIQGIDHLNTTVHREKCSSLGIQSTPGNLGVRVSDVKSVVGKSLPQILGVATDTVFPISNEERGVYVRQIVEADMSTKNFSKMKYRILKIRPDSNDAEVVVAELRDEDVETTQQSAEVPPESITAEVDYNLPQTAEDETSYSAQKLSFLIESLSNSITSDTQSSVHQGHVVPSSASSPKQSILYKPRSKLKSTSSKKGISKKGNVLSPSKKPQKKSGSSKEVADESAMEVDQIFYEGVAGVNEIEISEDIDFETVSFESF